MNKLLKPFKAGSNEIHDESLYTNYANSHSSPKSEIEVSQIIKECKTIGEKITVCGARTGLNGASVPVQGHSMSTQNLNKMNYIEENNSLEIGSGCTFEDIEKFVILKSKGKRDFPVSPTEKTATIGGAVSFNSSGLRSYRLGNVIDYVEEIQICNQNGEFYTLSKKDEEFNDFIGSEGMLGVITSLKLKTINKFKSAWGIMFFFESVKDSTKFVDLIDEYKQIQTLEYIDKNSFNLCEKYKSTMASIESIPQIQDNFSCGIYVEIYGDDDNEIEQVAEILMEKAIECNSDPDLAWAMSQDEMGKLQDFRHAISECFNMEVAKYNNVDSRIKLVNIDLKWKSKTRLEIIEYYDNLLKKTNLEYFIFGHIGSKAPYVNILTKTIDEYIQANNILENCYKSAIIDENNIFAEFGIGKLKKDIFCNSEKIEVINTKMKAKRKYDPTSLFNPNNMFSNNEL